mgnify:CR=1 FL=1
MLSAPLVMLLRPSGLARAAAGAASLFAFVIAVAMTIGVLEGNTYTYRMGSWPAPYGIELAGGPYLEGDPEVVQVFRPQKR